MKQMKKYNAMRAAYSEFKFLDFKKNRNRQNTENGVLYS